jgi:uncharacterized protein
VRAFLWFVGSILAAGLIGALVAYPAYELTSAFATWPFHRVAARIAMLALVVILFALCRRLHLTRRDDFGYALPWRRFVRVSLLWGAIGMFTAALGAVFLLVAHLRVGAADFVPSAYQFVRIFLVGVISGVSVALIEESVFRGVMHTAIERESSAMLAAALTAPLFAVLHFFAKVRIPAEELGWGSGFDLLLRSFAPLSHPGLVLDSFLSWLVVGLLLSLTRVLTGNIAVALGLHAGWVVVLRMLQESTAAGDHSSIWVGRFDGLLGYWLMPWGAALAAALWLSRGSWVPYARGASTSRR